MKKLFLFALMLVTFGMSGFAQSSVTIGVGDFTDWTSPIGGHYGYHYTAMLYTTSELAGLTPGSTITGMAFHLYTCNDGSVPVWIWLYETPSTSIDATQSWTALTTAATQVVDGDNINPTTDTWADFTFSTPYQYQGGNLVLLVYSTGCTGSGGCAKWGYFTNGFTGTGQCYICPKDNSPNDVNSPLNTYYWRNNGQYKSDVRFDYSEGAVSCHSVSGLHVSNITSTDADVSWTAPVDAGTYILEYKLSTQTWESTDVVSVPLYDTTYLLSGLQANTTYNVRVRNVCSASDSSYWQTKTFTTQCGAIDVLPFTEGFDTYSTGENAYPTCWTKINTYTSGNRPYVNSTHYNGVGSLYFYAGTSGTYNIAIIPMMDQNIAVNTLQADFMYRASNASDRLIVGVMTDPTSASTFVPVDTVFPASTASTWVERSASFASYTGTGQYIAFKNEYVSSTAYGYMDDLSIDLAPSCPRPQYLTPSSITADGCTVSWNQQGSETAWEVVVVPAGADVNTGTPEPVYTNPYTLTGLQDETSYDVYVRADCGGGDVSPWSIKGSFTTTPLCSSPLNVTVNQVAGTSAMVHWVNALYGATAYTVGYSEAGMDNWTVTPSIVGNQLMLSGLNPGTAYDVFVLSECAQGDADTTFAQFTTNCLVGGDLPIGDGTSTTSYFPEYCLYNYSYTQQIFLASEMGGSAALTSIAFDATTIANANRNLEIYLMHTSATSSSSWLDATSAQLVYSANTTLTTGWNTFNFTTPFQYNGTDNLAVIVLDLTGSWSGTNYFHSHTASGTLSRYVYQDSAPYSTSSTPSSGTSTTARNNVIFGVPCDSTVVCVAPNVYVAALDENSVTLAWAPGYTETSWEVEYHPTTDTNWVSEGTVSTVPYTVSNLDANTLYLFRVRSVCGGGDYSTWSVAQARTECSDIAVLPYTENFDTYGTGETAYPLCWAKINTYSSERPYVSSTSFEGAGSLYFYAGTTGTYNIAILPQFASEISVNTLQATFMYKANSSSDELIAGVMTDPTNASTFVPVATVHPSSSSPGEWVEKFVSFDSYTGSGQYIAFKTAYTTTAAYAYIDNISIDLIPSCAKPTSVVATSTTTDTVYLSWSDPTGSTWDVIYGPAGFDPANDMGNATLEQGITDNPYTITGLSGGMAYDFYVRSDCGGGLISDWSTYPASAYPFAYTMGISGSDTLSGCGFTITDNGGPDGDYGNGCEYSLVVFPSSIDSLVSISGTFAGESSLDYLEIYEGIGTSPSNLIIKIYSTMNGGSSGNVINFGPYTSDSGPLTLRFHTDGSVVYPGFIAEVSCVEAPTCIRPMQFVTTGSTNSEVMLDWMDHNETAWNVEYGPTGYTQGSGTVVTATTHPFTVTNLTAGTAYDFYVQADCGGGDTSVWTGPVSATPGSYNMPATGTYSITTCDMVIYDDGGATGNYSTNCDATLTIYPETTGNLVSVSGTVSTESSWDYLYIYDGAGTSGTQLGSYNGSGLTIPTLTSTTGPITLHFTSDGSVTYDGFAITVSCVSNTCPAPTNFTASNVGMNSADLSWTAGGSESAWVVEYKEANASNWTVVPVTTTSYQLTGLTALTSYNVRVKADCGGGDESAYVSTSFTTPNCNASDACQYTFVITDGYGDGWNGGYLTVEQNGTVVATIEATDNSSNPSTETVTITLCDNLSTNLVWHVGTFDDEVGITLNGPDGAQLFTIYNLDTISSSTIYTFTTSCNGSGPVPTDPTVATNAAGSITQTAATLAATITNPDNVTITAKGFEWKTTTGGTYTQIAGTGTGNNFTANLNGLTPSTGYTFKAFITYNGTTVYGSEMTFTTLDEEVEPCDVPTGLTASDIQGESVTITWNNDANVSSWNIQYRPTGGQLSTATSTTNSYTLTGLTNNTTYEIQVQANCGDGNLSDWSQAISVTTTGIASWLDNSVTLYPNPANEVVNVQCTMNNVQWCGELQLLDVYGKLLQIVPITSETTQINVSGLANGMYFVRVTTEAGSVTKTFVKK